MTITVTVLGASGSYARPGGACSGYLVQGGGASVLMDCGPGTLANLGAHLPLERLDAIVVSHVHPDHWLELPVLRNALKYYLGDPVIPLWTTAGVLEAAEALQPGLSHSFPGTVMADGDEAVVGPFRLRTSRTEHSVETLACRLELDGRAVAYSADTGPGWSPAGFGAPIDLFIMEATGPHEWAGELAGVHCTATQAGELARAAGVGRLVGTHAAPTADPVALAVEAAAAFGAPVAWAEPHVVFTV